MDEPQDLRNIDILSDKTNKEMNKNRNKLSPRILKLHDAVAESLLLTEFNIQEKSLVSANIAHGWVTTLFAEESVLKKLEDKKEQLEAAYLQKYGKPDIPKYKIADEMEKNDQIKKLTIAIDEQTEVVRYLNEVVKIVKQGQWDIKNAISVMQLEK
jgi:hypothetical protein